MGMQTSGTGRGILVGTYRSENAAWIRARRLYNLPMGSDPMGENLSITRAAEAYGRFKAVVLYAGDAPAMAFAAEFREVVDRDWLKANGYSVAKTPHAKHYALFALGEKLSAAKVLSDPTAEVWVCSSRWTGKIDADFYSHPLPACGGKSIPNLFEKLRPYFRKWKSAQAFNPVQMEFFEMLVHVKGLQQEMTADCDRSTLRFIDLFAGIGGIRKGFEQACADRGIKSRCVFTSEIKPHAIEVLRQNHPNEHIHGDITKVDAKSIPDFDILLGGFPCQAFSAAGKRLGFEDTRGTLFFDVARIIKEKKPLGFILENVEGLVNHDKREATAEYGRTLEVILTTLAELGYKVAWRVLNARDFGVPQDRKRIYIVGARCATPDLTGFEPRHSTVGDVLEHGMPTARSPFIDKLLAHYTLGELAGKSIKDKRGGANNIHSWDFEYKGCVSARQRRLLNELLKERRKHQWAEEYGIEWMDGMPLTIDMIRTFFDDPHLKEMLEDLVSKRYVVKEHPKRKVKVGNVFVREQDPTLPLGYNIVAGKMSFEISKILSPKEIAPTLVAMDMQHLYVADGDGLRNLTLREGLNLFGYPKDFRFDVAKDLGYDLLGNTVVVPVIRAAATRLLATIGREK